MEEFLLRPVATLALLFAAFFGLWKVMIDGFFLFASHQGLCKVFLIISPSEEEVKHRAECEEQKPHPHSQIRDVLVPEKAEGEAHHAEFLHAAWDV